MDYDNGVVVVGEDAHSARVFIGIKWARRVLEREIAKTLAQFGRTETFGTSLNKIEIVSDPSEKYDKVRGFIVPLNVKT